jgi:hypothetical protein
LEAVDWAVLGHAYGSAEDMCEWLRALHSADPEVRQWAYEEWNIVHGTRYSATAPAVPFLADLATAPDTHDRARLVNLLAYAAVGHEEAVLPDGMVSLDRLGDTPAGPSREYAAWAVAAYQAVQHALPVLLPLLDEDDDRLRRETAHLLAWFPSSAAANLPRLRACLPLETARDTWVTMIVAVGLLAGATGQTTDTPWLSLLLAGLDHVLRWRRRPRWRAWFPSSRPKPPSRSCWAGSPIRRSLTPLPSRPTPTPFPAMTTCLWRVHPPDPGPARPAARQRVTEALLAKLEGASGWRAERYRRERRLLWSNPGNRRLRSRQPDRPGHRGSLRRHRGDPGPPAETGGGQQPHHLASRGVIPAGAQMQVHPATLPLDLIHLALAVILTASLEGQQLGVPRERLERGQHISHSHAPSVATQHAK